MVRFFLPFWKVCLRNTRHGCRASTPPQSTVILGGAWTVPFFSLLILGPTQQFFCPLPQMVVLNSFQKKSIQSV